MQNNSRTATRAGLTAAALSAAGIFFGTLATYIVAGMIGVGAGGSFALATKIVDAIIAGSTTAAIVALLLGGGLGAGVIATIRWAIGFWGRTKAIA
jgi:hypothetical protein